MMIDESSIVENEKVKKVNRIISNNKDDQPKSGVFRDNTSTNTGIDSRQHNRGSVKPSISRLSEKRKNSTSSERSSKKAKLLL